MKKLLFLTRSQGGTDNEKIRSFDFADRIKIYNDEAKQIMVILASDIDQHMHYPIIDDVEYRILFMIDGSNEMIDGYVARLKLRDECHVCYYYAKAICPVNTPEITVGDVHIISMFIKNEQPRRELCDHFRENRKRTPCQALIEKVRVWLGDQGREFFTEVKEKYGELNACWTEGKVPHPVHFREGMQVRNFMRSTGLCLDWDAIDYDDNWVETVERALNI